MAEPLIEVKESLLLVVDVQEKLWPHIASKEEVRDQCRMLIEGALLLQVPIMVSEQYPKGLGSTLPELRQAAGEHAQYCEKTSFGCFGDSVITDRIIRRDLPWLVLCGIESHVCVLQTALEGLAKGLQVAVVEDAVGSRDENNHRVAMERIRDAGGMMVTVEMVLFEWMRTSKHPSFKDISRLVK
jgi:nicotinamidase-related amidase